MSEARSAALAVLDWCRAPSGPPPRGGIRHLDALVGDTDVAVRRSLSQLAAATAARLGLETPPLGDARPVNPAAAVLAAAIGVSGTPVAVTMVQACPPPSTAWDQVVRHGLVGPVLQPRIRVAADLGEALFDASPLTGALCQPFAEAIASDAAAALCENLIRFRDGRRMLMDRYCRFDGNPALLESRGKVLDRLRVSGPEGIAFVLDVYEAAVALDREAWVEATRRAQLILADADRALASALAFAQALAAWWAPLSALHRSHLDWIRSRSDLDFDVYLAGIRLVRQVAILQEGRF